MNLDESSHQNFDESRFKEKRFACMNNCNSHWL